MSLEERQFVEAIHAMYELGNALECIAKQLSTRPDVVQFVLRKRRCPVVQLTLPWEDCPTQDT
jgi:hypothetical protein